MGWPGGPAGSKNRIKGNIFRLPISIRFFRFSSSEQRQYIEGTRSFAPVMCTNHYYVAAPAQKKASEQFSVMKTKPNRVQLGSKKEISSLHASKPN